MPDRIVFAKLRDPYGQFSNFFAREFLCAGLPYPTAEHAYQAMKFEDPALQERVRLAPGPRAAAAIGRDRSLPLRPGWEDPIPPSIFGQPPAILERQKDGYMYWVLYAKFQDPELCALLLSTGEAEIVEDSSKHGDAYWGEVSPGVGENKLGKILMLLRSRFRKEP